MATAPCSLTQVFGESKVNELDVTSGLVNDYILCLKITIYDALLVKVVQKNESLRSKILYVLQLNANLLFLVFI